MKLRKSNLERLDRREFDVLIVGGGINGAVAAAALTSQGARVALIERGDFASCTSQASSNLVWGGIKYLETGEFGLVRKLCKSRNRLLRSYPSSIREVRFLVQVAQGFRMPRLFLYLGALLYWAMGNFFTRPPRIFSRKDLTQAEPLLQVDHTQGGFEYSDAYLVDNDARFVFGFIRAALDHGAIVANYVESLGANRDSSGQWHTRARDVESGRTLTIRSRVLINACGPYVDTHNQLTHIKTGHRHLFSKGVHLLVRRIGEVNRVLTFFADDGRLFFVIPMGPKSCVGTTDTRVEDLPARVTDEDRDFILHNVNKRLRLPQPLTRDDILAERCGVRPLVVPQQESDQTDADWTALSRKHILDVNKDRGHISIFGGKLTDCINVGEEVSQTVAELGIALPYRGRRWYGEPGAEVRDEFFHQAQLMGLDDLTAPESSEPLSSRLWRRYQANALSLLEDIRQDPRMAEVLIHGTEYLRCEIAHAARCEMVVRLEDFLRRRSKIALIAHHDTIHRAPGLMEACEILFEQDAEAQFTRYFRGQRNGSPPGHPPTSWLST